MLGIPEHVHAKSDGLKLCHKWKTEMDKFETHFAHKTKSTRGLNKIRRSTKFEKDPVSSLA